LIWPIALSVLVLVACGAWEAEIRSRIAGPEHSVDFRPLVPFVTGAAAVAAIWLVAGLVWVVRLSRRARMSDGSRAPR